MEHTASVVKRLHMLPLMVQHEIVTYLNSLEVWKAQQVQEISHTEAVDMPKIRIANALLESLDLPVK